jgi:N-acetylneuraminic acid mutarotase
MMRFMCRPAALAAVLVVNLCLASGAAAQALPLTIHLSGSSNGRVGVIPTGTLCDMTGGSTSTCVVQIPAGEPVRVVANAPQGQIPGLFSGGTGPAAACGFSACSFTMTAAADLDVNFSSGNGPFVDLTTNLVGDGRGTVGADNSRCQNIDPIQGNGCTTRYIQGSPASIGATPGPGSRFFSFLNGTGGAGVCGTNTNCTFTITGNATVTGEFHGIVSLAVTPSSATKAVGQAQSFAAEGTFSDGVTEDILPGMGAWVTVTNLPAPRFSLAATAIGSKVYAIGGIEAGGPSATVTAYDPSTLTWTTRAAMSVPREGVGVTTAGGFIYAAGGNTSGSVPVAALERYDPDTNSWLTLAPMPAPRRFLAAAAAGGRIYAAGGETVSGGVSTVVSTVEMYDPATDTWTARAPMLLARKQFGLVAIDGILYAVGGGSGGPSSSVEAYDPATNTWTPKTSMPGAVSATSAAAADGVLYVAGGNPSRFSTYGYDVARDSWFNKLNMPTGRGELAVTALDGIVYAIGGLTNGMPSSTTNKVETFIDTLRWSSSQPAIASVTQQGTAAAMSPGSAAIAATIGSLTCSSCATLTAFNPVPSEMALEAPGNNAQVPSPFQVSGWAINRGAQAGTGIDTVHVYAAGGGSVIFLGVATYGGARADIAALYGPQFTNSGFTLTASLAPGTYNIVAFGHNTLQDTFDVAKSATISIRPAVSIPQLYVDAPAPSAVVTSAFEVTGWAADLGAGVGTGVDALQFYVQPAGTPAPGVFVGTGSYGAPRPDVAAIMGNRFLNSGYHFTITGLGPGSYTLAVFARSTVTGTFSMFRTVPFSVNANQLMSIDVPSPESTVTDPAFLVAGWAIDRSAASGAGVDEVHVYAFPNPGSGEAAVFLGLATVGIARSDVGAAYGARFTDSGYGLIVNTAAAGLAHGVVYNIAAVAHSTASNTFNNVAVVRVRIQ